MVYVEYTWCMLNIRYVCSVNSVRGVGLVYVVTWYMFSVVYIHGICLIYMVYVQYTC